MRCKKNAYLQICHSIKQKEYVDWKYLFLKKFVISKPKAYKGNGGRVGYRFCTKSSPIFTPFFRDFYGNGKKSLPEHLALNELVLAIWYMDDGSRNRKSAYLNTQQFSLHDQRKMLSLLRKHNYQANLNRDGKYWRIRFYQSSAQRLKKAIQKHLPDCMQYKLPL